jgi:CubicO group peptidase (beta-lactamase class C family)
MRQFHVPGVGIAIVRNGKIVLQKGYGYASLERKVPVTIHTTWRMASIAVPMTAAAVLSLVGKHRVGLHTDVNRYLRQLEVPHTYPQPLTLFDLLTQTGGFDDPSWADETLTSTGIEPFCRYLHDTLPARAMPPGRVSSTTDWNTSLAGCVVEDAGGMRFERYVDSAIFRPLGMRQSTFLQPAPRGIAATEATGYDGAADATDRSPAPEAYNLTVPAAGLRSSVADISRWMLAQLGGATPDLRSILQPASVAAMTHVQFTDYRGLGHYPTPAGQGYGYALFRHNGQAIWEADGGVRGFISLMRLVPAHRFGLFLVTNMSYAGWIFDLQQQILDHVFPTRAIHPPSVPAALRGSLDGLVGTYWPNTYARHTVAKLGQLNNELSIAAVGPGRLSVRFADGSSVMLTRVAPLLFEAVVQGQPFFFGFRTDSAGHASEFLNGGQVFEPIPWYDRTTVTWTALGIAALLFLSGLVMWALWPAVRRRSLAPRDRGSRWDRRAERVCWPLVAAMSTVNVLALTTTVMLFQIDTSSTYRQYDLFTYSVPWYLYAILAAFVVGAILAVLTALAGVIGWRRLGWHPLRRAHFALLTLGGLAFIGFLANWNLLGFHV